MMSAMPLLASMGLAVAIQATAPVVQTAEAETPSALLVRAVDTQDIEAARQALSKGADVNAPGTEGMTPLMQASTAGSVKVAEFLLDGGAKVDGADEEGITPLMLAAS